jgi:DNA polymerase-3 subunit epsilon
MNLFQGLNILGLKVLRGENIIMSKDIKICYLDTETTGLDSEMCDIWQVAFIIEINGKVEEKRSFKMAPLEYAIIESDAIEMQGFSEEDLYTFPDRNDQFKKIKKFLERYISKFNKEDKFLPVGYNVRFDIDFLRQFWLSFGDKYYGSYFLNAPLDVLGLAGLYMTQIGITPKNFKLGTMCEFFNIPLKAHDALEDITATRTLYLILKETFKL